MHNFSSFVHLQNIFRNSNKKKIAVSTLMLQQQCMLRCMLWGSIISEKCIFHFFILQKAGSILTD